MVSFLLPSLTPTLLPRSKDLMPLKLNKLLIHGETDGLITPVQLLTHMDFINKELTQMVTPSTTVSFLIQSSRPTPMPRPPEPLLFLLNKLLMPGEMEPLQTLDQLSFMLKSKTQLIMTTTRLFWVNKWTNLLPGKPNIKPNLTGVKPSNLELTPGDLFHTLPRTLNGKVLPPLLKDNQAQAQPTMDLLTKH